MIRWLSILLITLFLTLAVLASVSASAEPVGACPDGFALHAVMEHEEHGHHHVGSAVDRNGDGWICAKHVSAGGHIHVHIDNQAALP
jgi:hypothetical protein